MHKLTLSACFLLLTAVLLQAQPHAALQEKVYPNPEGITFTTPTLSIDENRFASYEEIMAWLDVRARDPRMTCTTIGTTTKGRAVPMYRLHNDTKGPKVKVWLQGAIHGNEPAAAEGLFMLTDYLLRTPEGGKLLDRMDVYILPMANLDGYLANKRVSGDGYDLNRDQTKFADPQSVMIKRAFMQVNPDVAVDFHEFQPNRSVKVHSETPNAILYYDALFLPTGYPNVPQTLRDATIRLMEEPCAAALDAIGYSHFEYFTITQRDGEMALTLNARSPQSSSTSYALSNAISFFLEIRGIGLGRLSLERRTYCGFTVAKTVLESTYAHHKEIRRIVRKAIRQTTKRKDPVTVLFHSREKRVPVTFLDVEKAAPAVLEDVLVLDAREPQADLVRTRPVAYLLDASETRAVENLRTLGLTVEQLDAPKRCRVETYRVTEREEADTPWEKIRRVTVHTEVTPLEKEFPAGTYVVRLDQENANFAVSVLEPEAENGFVSFRVVEAQEGRTLPICRLLKF